VQNNSLRSSVDQRRYHVAPIGVRSITALFILRDDVIKSILAGIRTSGSSSKPPICILVDQRYDQVRLDLQSLLQELAIAV
jgi:hypothetical protein